MLYKLDTARSAHRSTWGDLQLQNRNVLSAFLFTKLLQVRTVVGLTINKHFHLERLRE